MATPKDLVKCVSRQTGVAEATVTVHDRNLLLAGLRTEGQRGRGKSFVSARDATNLLIAVAATRNVKDSVSAIERPGGLVSSAGRWEIGFIEIPELSALPADHSFADAIEALISAAISGSLQTAAEQMEAGAVDLIHDTSPSLNIEITILGPTPRGLILIEETVQDEDGRRYTYDKNHASHFYGQRRTGPGAGNLASFDIAKPKEMDSDLRSEMTFTHRTIAAVGALLADRSSSDS